jgi:invasion protein IalB
MINLLKTAALAALLASGGAAFAQSTNDAEPHTDEAPADAEAAPAEGTAPDALALSMGDDAADGPVVGAVYTEATFTDWELRCIKTEAEIDPCQLYQLLSDSKGNPVAEINVFPLPAAQEAAAGATIITPLETLLTQQLAMSVDGATPKKYPFSWCSSVGCFSRLGFSTADIASLKRGNSASIVIVPVAAPDQKVTLKVSLSGFTAGYDAASKRIAN